MRKFILTVSSICLKKAAAFCLAGWILYEIGLLLYMRLEYEKGRGDVFALICFLCGLVMLHGLKKFILIRALHRKESPYERRMSFGSAYAISSAIVGILSGFKLIFVSEFGLWIGLMMTGGVMEIFTYACVLKCVKNYEKCD